MKKINGNIKKLSVIFSSHYNDELNNDFIEHLKTTSGVEDILIQCINNYGELSLCEAYNLGWKKLDELGRGNDIIVFCHNDIVIKTKDWGKVLLNLFKVFHNYDIIGIAGTTELNSHGCWWLKADGKEMNFPKMVGRVWHTNGIREWESIYTEKIRSTVKDVVVVDGLFFAVNGETVVKRFNEDYKNFHFYDISFSFENYLEGCNIGVIDRISVLHKSVGMTNQNWEINRNQFVNQFKDELPISI